MKRSYCSFTIMGTRSNNIVAGLIMVLLFGIFNGPALAAVGCTLNDPDRDVKRLFPQSTGYKTIFVTIQERGGEALQKRIEEKLGDAFDPIYEGIDVPYAYYDVLKGKEVIGRIHGVNQKGTYGGMQIILATDLDGRIQDFYYQKISSPESRRFRDTSFTRQFTGLGLEDFYNKDITIADPSEQNHEDYVATLRGVKKNLILLDIFMFDQKKNGGGNEDIQ